MVHAKNYETAFTFVKVIHRKPLASVFSRTQGITKHSFIHSFIYFCKISR